MNVKSSLTCKNKKEDNIIRKVKNINVINVASVHYNDKGLGIREQWYYNSQQLDTVPYIHFVRFKTIFSQKWIRTQASRPSSDVSLTNELLPWAIGYEQLFD